MIKERNIAICVILSIITCGIYGIYWEVCLVNDVNTVADTPNDTSGVMVIILGIITCSIYLLYWMYKSGEKIQTAEEKRGISGAENQGLIYLILAIFGFGIVSWCLIQNELNKMATPNA